MRRARNTILQASGPGSQAPGRGPRNPGSSPLDRCWGGHYISRASPAGPIFTHGGPVAEWLCRGLQSPVRRFDSGPGLQSFQRLNGWHNECRFFVSMNSQEKARLRPLPPPKSPRQYRRLRGHRDSGVTPCHPWAGLHHDSVGRAHMCARRDMSR